MGAGLERNRRRVVSNLEAAHSTVCALEDRGGGVGKIYGCHRPGQRNTELETILGSPAAMNGLSARHGNRRRPVRGRLCVCVVRVGWRQEWRKADPCPLFITHT